MPPADLDHALRALGFESFRPGQHEALETLLDRASAITDADASKLHALVAQLKDIGIGRSDIKAIARGTF